MIVIVLSACPEGLRGDLTKWLLEISAGVFVGRVNARVRELLWVRVVELARDGRAIMVYSARNEQRLSFRVHRNQWLPVDMDGLTLMLRPAARPDRRPDPDVRPGWSNVSRYRRAGQTKR
ncbi:type I-E CRISPR-associated endoribonuclease Cas2 [Arthrobacter woluwensis]|uniref:type I-E CRISPR-associated endoribonuclease Cas2e n=1 Tax=Arthrobacter woluwensis TaxID=156980 RepID=UPI000D12896E|nr:type I-E CRISPR-associated endoribonuclease Cas2e [Arthrobacter woluwensis]PSS43025.1 type I-E CRISPR-associated endoribonuclease Cas2 [Arthrobacter woluwensis]